jgi:uncharacterized protein
MFRKLIFYSVDHPRQVMVAMAILVALSLLQFPRIKIDTDPENMLPADAPVRVFHQGVKKEFSVYDMVVLGVVNQKDPNGVFNVKTLGSIYRITEEIKLVKGVIANEILAPSTKDNVEQAELGTVRFNWLMETPPKTEEEALRIRNQALNHPMFRGTMVSENGKAMCLFIPIERKDLSYEVAQQIRKIYAQYPGNDEFYITGLPVANDQFGVEMFKQMAISAPLAGLVIFLLKWFFFKSVGLIIAPMVLAIATVIITMGLLIGFGFPVHIMSSMIPIFLMPIAVLDSVHILSEFSEKYPLTRDRRKAILHVMDELFTAMLFTSLTSVAGFFSLSFTPIPPVQVFGVFVAIGIAIAWILTMTFMPAYVMLINQKVFAGMKLSDVESRAPVLNKILAFIKHVSLKHAKGVLAVSLLLVALSIYGITHIRVNDNPVRWFTAKHPIRVADRILNQNFSGTYEAYLVLNAEDKAGEVFLQPEMLKYIETLQLKMNDTGLVGKTTALSDIVKKIYYELLGGDKVNDIIPKSKEAVAQCLISFENSHKPDDLWHLTTPDYSKLNIWVQLRSGDNKNMDQVVRFVDEYFKKNPAPYPVEVKWAGLTYINVVWQNNMVWGMLNNFLGSFVIVLFMMVFLFRSPVTGLISMIPLTITILFIYSLLGFFGKDYDMPVAVLSALTLGLSIDFAIHFIQRASEIHREVGSWEKTADQMFLGPGRAVIRNALVVAIGFLPLLAAPLVPYKTVGFFMFTIMAFSSVATLFMLPAVITLNPALIFEEEKKKFGCKCSHCVLLGAIVAFSVAYVLLGYTTVKWQPTTFISIGIIIVFSTLCHFAAKRKICITNQR